MQYKQIRVGDLSDQSLKKCVKGGILSIPASKMSGNRVMLVHPLNYEKFQKAKKANRGVRLPIAVGEINADLDFHESSGGSLHGGSLWSWLKTKAFPWMKKTLWPALKPVLSPLVDQGATMLGTYTGQPALVGLVRNELKNQTGVGISKKGKVQKGSTEAKERMARVRAMRKTKTGGSFIL